MTANWPRVRALFERAIELPSVQRAAFLDAEVGADGFGAREELCQFGGRGAGGDVPILWRAGEKHVANAAAD